METVTGMTDAVIGVPEVYNFYEQCKARSDPAYVPWDKNNITLQSLFHGSRWEPTREVERIGDQRPMFYVVARDNKFIPLAEQKMVFERIVGPKDLVVLDSEHLDMYMGSVFEENVVKQVEWLERWLKRWL